VRFCRWYPLAAAAAHAPAAEGVLQLRVATGLIDYPRGKSAMVAYVHAPDVRAAAVALAARHAGEALLCRHLESEADERGELDAVAAAAAYERLRGEFVRRFGAAPGAGEVVR
jgi:hypothetical protein